VKYDDIDGVGVGLGVDVALMTVKYACGTNEPFRGTRNVTSPSAGPNKPLTAPSTRIEYTPSPGTKVNRLWIFRNKPLGQIPPEKQNCQPSCAGKLIFPIDKNGKVVSSGS
jgi:hypothetical protein